MFAEARPDRETTLVRGDLALHVEHFRPLGDKQLALVMVHGFSAHCGLYRHVAACLAAQGIAVTGFDCRGHGRSGGRRGHVDDFSDYVDDLSTVVAWAREQDRTLPWALLGHSLGGSISLAYVLDEARRQTPERLVLAAPWLKLRMKVPMPKRLGANVVARVLPTFSMWNGLRAEEVTRNPEARVVFERDTLIHHIATAGWFMATIRAQANIRTHAECLRIPTLMLLAGDDRIVANEASLSFAKNAGAFVEVRTCHHLFHDLYVEPEAEQVIADIGAWLRDPSKKQMA